MNETTSTYIYDYDGFTFKTFIPDYWKRIYKGKPRNTLYNDYQVMLELVKKVDKSKWIMDVGVNNGLFAIPASMLGYKVLGFEPVHENYVNLRDARVGNELLDFDMFKLALSNKNETVEIYIPECRDNASLSQDAALANMKGKEYEIALVDAVRFDDWIQVFPQYKDIGFIKLDVQGAEFDCLSGMKRFLSNAHDIYLLVEYENHSEKFGHTFQQLDELISSYGFVEQPKILPNDKLFFKV